MHTIIIKCGTTTFETIINTIALIFGEIKLFSFVSNKLPKLSRTLPPPSPPSLPSLPLPLSLSLIPASAAPAMATEPNAAPLFSAQQIQIPPQLPQLLKNFSKAAIRSQPADLLQWAADYFQAMAAGQPLPVATRAAAAIPAGASQPPPAASPAAALQALVQQLREAPSELPQAQLVALCAQVGMAEQAVSDALALGNFKEQAAVAWVPFVALQAAALRPGLMETLEALATAFADGPNGDGMPQAIFDTAYTYLAGLDGQEAPALVEAVVTALSDRDVVTAADVAAARQEAMAAGAAQGRPSQVFLAVEGHQIAAEVSF